MKKHRILILGGSGFIGQTLYKELSPYFDTYATYHNSSEWETNQRFFAFDLEQDDLIASVEKLRPSLIINALRGPYTAITRSFRHLCEYLVKTRNVRLITISSANVFDGYTQLPNYEYDKTLSQSNLGKYQIHNENQLMKLPEDQWSIIRIPMVFGNGSPRILELRYALQQELSVEVFPNLSINVTYADKLAQQLHYLINRSKKGIFHLGSNELCLHEDFVKSLINRLGNFHPRLKRVYTTNDIRYAAVLSKDRPLPKYLQFGVNEVINHHLPL